MAPCKAISDKKLFQKSFFCFLAVQFFFGFSGIKAHASSSLSSAPLSSIPIESNDGAEKGAKFKAAARIESDYYPSPLPSSPQLSQSVLATAAIKFDYSGRHLISKVDADIGQYVDLGQGYNSIPEVYVGGKYNDDKTVFTVGRELQYWSALDQDWKLGEWQPNYIVDLLQIEPQGLTGLFFTQRYQNLEFLSYASVAYVPTFGPTVHSQNGALIAPSRWFQQPTQSAQLLGANSKVNYDLRVPNISQLQGNPGAGARLLLGETQKGIWASANYAHKPMNTPIFKYDAAAAAEGYSINTVIIPTVAFQDLWGGDLGITTERGRYSISYLEDDPVVQYPKNNDYSDYWQQEPSPMKMYSVHADTNTAVPLFRDPVFFAVDYLRVLTDPTFDYDSTGVPRMSIVPYRVNFFNALSFRTKVGSYLLGKKIETQLTAIRDFDQNGNVYESALDVHWNRSFIVSGGLDVLSPDDPSLNNTDPRFINQFRANDRVFGGLHYIF